MTDKAARVKRILPWLFVPVYFIAVVICVNSLNNAGFGLASDSDFIWNPVGALTVFFIAAVMLLLLLALRFLFRREGLCRDGLSSMLVLIPFCALMLARLSLFDYATLDYEWFLQPWVEFYRRSGGLNGLREPVGNYNIPYLTMLAVFSYSPIYDLYLIKLSSVIFDILLAYFLFKITGELTRSINAQIICFYLALALPTVFMNGSVWGQCDSIYGAFAVGALYFAIRTPKTTTAQSAYIRTNSVACYICAAAALSYKLQAVFVMPIILPLLFNKRISLKFIWVFPMAYLFMISPALLAGRSFMDTITIYFSELDTVGRGLNYNAPSIFSLPVFRQVHAGDYEWYNANMIGSTRVWGNIGIILAGLVCVLVVCLSFVYRKKLEPLTLCLLASILATGIPMFLPHMHDRYFFLADVLLLPVAVVKPKYLPFVALTVFASILGYHAYLRQRWLLTMEYGFYALSITLFALVAFFILETKTRAFTE